MKNFIGGGRELPFGEGDHVNVLSSYQDLSSHPKEENKSRLCDRLLHFVRNDETWGNDAGIVRHTAYSLWPIAIKIIFCVLFSWSLISPVCGQEAKGLNDVQPVRIGQKLPEDFWEKEHLFYINGDTVRQTLAEHKGKLLVLDFYMTGCGPCMLHQQEIAFYQQKYPKEIAVIMVNSQKTKEDYDKIDKLFTSGYFRRFSIDSFSSIIEDYYLEQLFPYAAYPSYFWINQQGYLQTYTYRNLLDRNYSAPFL